MSIRRIPGRLKKNNVFEILPYMIKKKPELEPINIMGEELIKKTNKKIVNEAFDFLSVNNKAREILYSTDDYKLKCLYCGEEFYEMGCDILTINKKHTKKCRLSFIVLSNERTLFTIKTIINKSDFISKELYFIRMINHLTNKKIEFHLKKRYEYEPRLIHMDNLKIELRKLKDSTIDINISTIRNIFFKYIKIKNG